MRSILSQAWLAMATLIAIFAVPAWAEGQRPLTVMTSIKPLQLITSELTNGVTKTEVLLSTNTSPHDYALKPSDVKKLKTVDLFVWVGPGLESFLEGVMQGSKNSLQLDLALYTGHIQIASIPERHEPSEGEVNYPYLFNILDKSGYKGWIGCEYNPKNKTEDGLAWVQPYL